MGSYMVIADVGQAIVRLLRSRMVPEVIPKEEQIGLCTPREPGNYRLGIYLYDIQESDAVRNAPERWQGEDIRVKPPMYLDLYYIMIPFSQSDWRYRSVEEQKILGKMIQIMRDFPLLNADTYEAEERMTSHTIQIEVQDISYEEKAKIWNSLNEAMRNAVYCKVSPVEMESGRYQQVKRVREVRIQLGEGGNI